MNIINIISIRKYSGRYSKGGGGLKTDSGRSREGCYSNYASL